MRVGFIKVSPLEGDGPRLSGVTSVVRDWAGALHRRGHESFVFALHASLHGESGAQRYWRSVLGHEDLRVQVESWIQEHGIDLVHMHTSLRDTFRILRRPFGCPVVISVHTFEPVCPLRTKRLPDGMLCRTPPGLICVRTGCRSLRKYFMHDVQNRRILEKNVTRLASVIVHNRSLKRMMEESKWPVSIGYVPLGIDRSSFTETSDPGGSRVMYVGRLRPEKGVDVLVRAMAIVHQSNPDASLALVGAGSSEDELRTLSQSLGLASVVEFRGAMLRSELPEQYSSADIVCVPSVWEENVGLVGIEAMACGRPVIGSDVSGVREWLNPGVEGILVSPGDADELAAAIIAMLDDPAMRRAMGRAAFERAKAFDIEKTADDLVRVYQAALDGTN